MNWPPTSVGLDNYACPAGAWHFLNKELEHSQPDLIEFYGAEFWLATSMLAKRKTRPLLVAHTNGLELLHLERARQYSPSGNSIQSGLRTAWSQLTEPKAFSRSDAFVALCELDQQYVLEHGYYPADKTCVIAPGLDEEYLNRPAPSQSHRQKRIAFTGSWTPRKAPQIIVEVMAKVLRNKFDLAFDIFGSGRDESLSHAFPEDVRGRVNIHPRISNHAVAEGLSQCQVFFFPSEYEGYGMALAEAMSCGCAAVATPTGFGAELTDGKDALLCEFGAAEQMERAILKLLDDDTLRMNIADNGWKRTQHMQWSRSVKQLSDIYEKWVGQRNEQRDSGPRKFSEGA